MSSRVGYQCTALAGTGKKGILRPDAAGYYTLPFGAFNVLNSAGEFYQWDPVKRLFESSSALQRRIASGQLRSEYGHPKKPPGMSGPEFLMRIMRLEEQSICGHIKSLEIDFDANRTSNGQNIVTIMGSIKPSGPFGDALAAQFENACENVAFSIRSFVDTIPGRNGVLNKIVKEIITYDYVNEPGISLATKYNSPSLEEFDSCGFGFGHLIAAQALLTQTSVGMESDEGSILARTMEAFNLAPSKTSELILPKSMEW